MYHHTSSTVAHTPNLFQNQSSLDDEEDTSLYSPLPIARPDGNDNGVNVTGTTINNTNANEDKTNINTNPVSNQSNANAKSNHIKQSSSMNLNSYGPDRKSIITLRQNNQNETDEDYDEDDDEELDEVGYLENGIRKHGIVSTYIFYTLKLA